MEKSQKFDQISINNFIYYINNKPAVKYDQGMVFNDGEGFYLILNQLDNTDILKMAEKIMRKYDIDIITIVLSNPIDKCRIVPQIPLGKPFHSWYCLGYPYLKNTLVNCFGDEGDLSFRKQLFLSDETRSILKYRWQTEYIDTVLARYSQSFKNTQYDNYQQMIDAEEGLTHFIVFKKDKLVGHLSLKKCYFSLIRQNSMAIHRWVHQNLSKKERIKIHEYFQFQTFNSQDYPKFSGVAHVNEKSLVHELRNGGRILHLRLKKLIGDDISPRKN